MGIDMKKGHNSRLDINYLRCVFLLKNLVDAQDHYTYVHSFNVSKYAAMIGEKINLDSVDVKTLSLAGLLHDIGKSKLPTELLLKKEVLSLEEFKMLKLHSEFGADIVESSFHDLRNLKEIILCHHERYDGKGYPFGLKGEEIPLLSRIICVADSFDAMITDRPYKKGITIRSALIELKKNKSKQFDAKIVEAFIDILSDQYFRGEASNVIFNNSALQKQ